MASHADDELKASTTEGYKAGEKKTLDEYKNLGEYWHKTSSDSPNPAMIALVAIATVVATAAS
jgi:hypothetical protein